MADENNAVDTSKKKLRQVSLLGSDGVIKYQNVFLAPDASEVYIMPTEKEGTKASLKDFLFTKYKLKEVTVDKDGKIIEPNSEDAVGTRIIQVIEDGDRYYEIDPSKISVWQQWNDYQEILKKRLVGLYNNDGDYQGDFIQKLENDPQAQLTLEDGSNTNISNNIEAIINKYNLKDDYALKEDGTKDDTKPITVRDQAIALALMFGNESMWQRIVDNDQKKKDTLWGIYNTDGQLVGHFEATVNNIDAILQVYKNKVYFTDLVYDENGEPKKDADGKLIYQESAINTPDEAYNLLVDLSKKSIYQHLVDLRDFWIYLPIEYYEQNNPGNSIVTRGEINSMNYVNPWEVSE